MGHGVLLPAAMAEHELAHGILCPMPWRSASGGVQRPVAMAERELAHGVLLSVLP